MHDHHLYEACLPAISRHSDPDIGLIAAPAEDGPHRVYVIPVLAGRKMIDGDPLLVFEFETERALIGRLFEWLPTVASEPMVPQVVAVRDRDLAVGVKVRPIRIER